MTAIIRILLGTMLLVLSLAEKDTSMEYGRPTPPTNYARALNDNDDNVPTPECTANDTDTDRIYLRNGLIDPRYRWKVFRIYIDPVFTDEERKKINDAAYILWQESLCVESFIWYRESRPSGDYVHIKKGQGCWSWIGRIGGAQDMYLETPGCMKVGVIMHEMLHAYGFEHEHKRSDRDDFVNIHWDNIKDRQAYNFHKKSPNTVTHYGVPYNIYSIMHYHSHAFSKNKQATITDKNGGTFDHGCVLQESDKQKLKKMYNC